MKARKSRFDLKSLVALTLGSIAMLSIASAEMGAEECSPETNVLTQLSASDLKTLNEVMHDISSPKTTQGPKSVDYATHKLDDSKFDTDDAEPCGMQIGLSGNPDVDKGKPFRAKSWVISILCPVKTTSALGLPTTIYVEARCHALGKQPVSAYTDNNNIRCGPGVVTDVKLTDWMSMYTRVDSVTSRFGFNGAPVGQMNPKTGRQFRDYKNDTWFTGVGIGGGVKFRILKDTALFAEYTKYKVQQTDNKAYQFRGAYTAGISRKFWLFQKPGN